MEYQGARDAKLVAKSIRENWPMTPEKRRVAIEFLKQVVAEPSTRPKTREGVERVLNSVTDDWVVSK
jgi:hypothetical protein